MIVSVWTNIGVAWCFTSVLFFRHSLRNFEETQAKRLVDLFAILTPSVTSKRTSSFVLTSLTSESRENEYARIQRHNLTYEISAYAVGGVILTGVFVASYLTNTTASALVGIAIGTVFLITEVLLYLVLYRAYDYGIESRMFGELARNLRVCTTTTTTTGSDPTD